ncbi:hypothetical protein KP509_27G058800 [Ceratopteris richardii]|uniref:U-box domain-containing protein n=1 Tax=Ceratopteris richardii TaxID=49495 RepID=A0A8T2RJ94_CERRI|nr:hypothetical protein KP509_27G058800 [Ceratopteris richardii]
MSSTYNSLLPSDAIPPTSRCAQTAPITSCADVDIFNNFVDMDSPPSSSIAVKRRASPKRTYRKWKAVLAHFSPPRLALPPPTTLKPSISCLSRPSATSSPSSNSACPAVDDLPIDGDGQIVFPVYEARLSCDPDPAGGSDVQKLLRTLELAISHSHEQAQSGERTHLLRSLYSLCITSPVEADLCISEGGVETVLRVLNLCADFQSSASVDMTALMQESEKALLLLQLLTSSSADGCTTALNQSSLLISTLGKKLLRVSEACTHLVITILTMLCRHPSADALDFSQAVSETAIPSKLVVVLQVASRPSTKRKAGALLRLLGQQKKMLEERS